jgi:serine/threonine protein kinase
VIVVNTYYLFFLFCRWNAPETKRGEEEITSQADIYSLGLVLWELVTKEMPFGELGV